MIPRISIWGWITRSRSRSNRLIIALLLGFNFFAQISYCSSNSDELLTKSESRRVRVPSPYYTSSSGGRRPPPSQELEERPNYDNYNSSPSYSEGGGGGGSREENVGFMDQGPPKGFPTFEEIQAHFQETSASHSTPGERRPRPEYDPRGPPSEYSSSFGEPPPPQFSQSGAGPRPQPQPSYQQGSPYPVGSSGGGDEGRRPYFDEEPGGRPNFDYDFGGPPPSRNHQSQRGRQHQRPHREDAEPDFPHRQPPPFPPSFGRKPLRPHPGQGQRVHDHPHHQRGSHHLRDHHPRPNGPGQGHEGHHHHHHQPNDFREVSHHHKIHPGHPHHHPILEHHNSPQYFQPHHHSPPQGHQGHQGHVTLSHHHSYTPKTPIVLKVSSLNTGNGLGVGHTHNFHHPSSSSSSSSSSGSDLPGGPPIFYAPSPDVELAQKKQKLKQQQELLHQQSQSPSSPLAHAPQPQFTIPEEAEEEEDEGLEPHPNFKRENPTKNQQDFQRLVPRRKGPPGGGGQVILIKQSSLQPNHAHTHTNPNNYKFNNGGHLTDKQSHSHSHSPTNKQLQLQQREKDEEYAIDHNSNPTELEEGLLPHSLAPSFPPHLRFEARGHRSRRSLTSPDIDPMIADGTEAESFWAPAPAPYIRFDRYKNVGEESVEHHRLISPKSRSIPMSTSTSRSSNVTFGDSSSDEQRFFPSFPSPYLGGLNLSPFGVSDGRGDGRSGLNLNSLAGLSPARAPLFPGPAVNRAPSSRYHPASAPFKFGSSPLPNRGPSSAASHGHDRYREHDNNLLGSGNFEVIRGGTYYGDDDEGPSYNHHGASPYDDDAYYAQNNGHSSPYRGGGGDFFANFRDFADINPHSRSYSHQSETRVRPGSSSTLRSRSDRRRNGRANNIFDKLRGIRDEEEEELVTASSGDNHKPQFSLEYDPMMATF